MKYEAPNCELIEIDYLDIIRTSGANGADEDDGLLPGIDVPTSN